ncbi:hypothetical protein [Rhodococcus sp. BE178]|uniref:hypothetical protein n=1 Tax=Rhodococcus sp. BE178 TaxID=2817737 RepID=UPI003D240D2D
MLERFAADRFWSVRIAVAEHPNETRSTVIGLLEPDPRRRGVVHHAARKRLEREGVEFGDGGMPTDYAARLGPCTRNNRM